MGLGYALSKDLRFKGGEVLTRNFDSYELPRFSNLPRTEIDIHDAPDIPAQGGGEPAIVPVGARDPKRDLRCHRQAALSHADKPGARKSRLAEEQLVHSVVGRCFHLRAQRFGGLAVVLPEALAMLGTVLTGLAVGWLFPTALRATGGAEFREHSGTVFGILFTMALTGGMTMPWVARLLAHSTGLRAVFAFAAANFAEVAVLGQMATRTRQA